MEDAGSEYNIFYRRDQKHIWVGLNDIEAKKGFSIIGYPNPFSEILTINVSVDDKNEIPQIKIYNSKSQLINILVPIISSTNEYKYHWSGLNMDGDQVNSGIYVIACSVGNKMTARKVALINR